MGSGATEFYGEKRLRQALFSLGTFLAHRQTLRAQEVNWVKPLRELMEVHQNSAHKTRRLETEGDLTSFLPSHLPTAGIAAGITGVHRTANFKGLSGHGDMAWKLKILIIFTQDLDLVPSTHMAIHNINVSSVPGDPMPWKWPSRAPGTHMHTFRETHIQIKSINLNEFF